MIYLIHFDEPLHHARHYVGWTGNGLMQRVDAHRRGQGSRLVRAVNLAGIEWEVVLVWPGDRNDERAFKNLRCTPRYCPVCRGPGHRRPHPQAMRPPGPKIRGPLVDAASLRP